MKLSSPFSAAIDSTSSLTAPSTSRRSHISTGECIYRFGMLTSAVATPARVICIWAVSVPPDARCAAVS